MIHLRFLCANLALFAPIAAGCVSRVAAGPGRAEEAHGAPPSTIELRFCPATEARTYPLDSQHDVQGLVLQNFAVQNRGPATIELTAVGIDLLEGGETMESRRLVGANLSLAASTGPVLQKSGMLELFRNLQFCGDALIPGATKLGGAQLQPGEAMLVMYQPFAFAGHRDSVRLRVAFQSDGHAEETEQLLPIRTELSTTAFRFPLFGTSFAAVGPTLHTAHRWALPEQFGFDIVRIGAGGKSHRGDGATFEDYYAYGAEVRAAADGEVVAAANDAPEDASSMRRVDETDEGYAARVQSSQLKLLQRGGGAALGNYVVIRHTPSEFSLYAHLKPGSVRVKAGEHVAVATVIGLLGSSGNATEPHLHFQVCDRPDPLACAGVPVRFTGIQLPYADAPRPLQSGDVVVAE